MKKKTIYWLLFTLFFIAVVLISALVKKYYSTIKCPVRIVEVRLYQNEPRGWSYGAYINCEGSGIDYCEIIMEIIREESFENSKDDAPSSLKTSDNLYVVRLIANESGQLKECFNIPRNDSENKILCIRTYINKTVDCNGNVWRATKKDKANYSNAFLNDGTIEEKPVHLCEASLISEYTATGEKKDDAMDLFISWDNISEDLDILNVFYKLYGVNKSGEIANIGGSPCEKEYSMDSIPKKNKAIKPGEENLERKSYVYTSDAEWIGAAERIFLTIDRVITTDGRVWYNKNNDDAIELVLDGKKGYSFNSKYQTGDVNQLIEKLKKSFEEEGLAYLSEIPLIALRDRQYLVLRYPQIDILVGLDNENLLSGDRVGIAYYTTLKDKNDKELADIKSHFKDYLKIIMPAVLTEMSSDYVYQCVEAYNIDENEEIDFNDDTYRTQYKDGKLYGSDYEGIFMIAVLVGKNLSDNDIYSLIRVLPSA